MNTLILEVTRKCTCSCEHCLRGTPQRKQMDEHMVRKILKETGNPVTLITGGEPLLNMPAVRAVLSSIETVLITTSGNVPKKNLGEFIDLLHQRPKYSEVYLSISEDVFHPKDRRVWDFKDSLDRLGIPWESSKTNQYNLLAMGRAYDIGHRSLRQSFLYEDDFDWYVTVDGDVYVTCDLSYRAMRRFKKELCVGNILTESIDVIEERYTERFLGKSIVLDEETLSIDTDERSISSTHVA